MMKVCFSTTYHFFKAKRRQELLYFTFSSPSLCKPKRDDYELGTWRMKKG